MQTSSAKVRYTRTIPSHVARQLRAEAGFGCAECGCPIIEYHHIIPWAEWEHYEVEHMVALCRNHHHEFGKQSPRRAYAVKNNPFNIRSGRFKGYLVTNRENQALVLGNSRFVGFSDAITYYGIPLFGYEIIDSELRLNCFIPDAQFFPEIEVKHNHLKAITDDFWDIEFKQNYVKFRKKKGEIFLAMDFRRDDVEVSGRFDLQGDEYRFDRKTCDFGGFKIHGITMVGSPGSSAVSHGSGRLLRPNYAQAVPKAQLLPK